MAQFQAQTHRGCVLTSRPVVSAVHFPASRLGPVWMPLRRPIHFPHFILPVWVARGLALLGFSPSKPNGNPETEATAKIAIGSMKVA
jgi:hypothetical protein